MSNENSKFYPGLLFLSWLAIFTWSPSLTFGEDNSSSLNFGGEIRLRLETLAEFDAFTPTRNDKANETFALMRVRAYLDAKPIEGLGIFLQPQFSREWAQEQSTVANTNNVDDLDLHQGYVDLKGIGSPSLSLRLGRQELAYGDERLIGTFGWSNVGRSFDAAKARWNWDHAWLDGFLSWIQSAPDNQFLSGLYGHWDKDEKTDYEAYLLSLNDKNSGVGGGDLNLYTIGGHLERKFGPWDYDSEVALQLGESGTKDVFAYAAHLDGGYTIDREWQPRLGLEYNVASGDDSPNSGNVGTFNNLSPTNHDKYGYMDLVGWRNIHNGRASIQLKPTPSVTTSLDYHIFFLMEPADGLYQASGAQLRAGSADASRYTGQEIDTLLKYKWNKWAHCLFGYSFFKAGDFLEDTGDAKDAHFLYAQITASY
ncbi:MAG: alginate export family protein [Deltaproteobacteria bacterium]|nr:alginate export family protein [Deltaproteobacteria bacterium]